MTVSTTTIKNSYSGNDVTTVFPFTFRVQAAAHLYVVLTDAENASTVQILNTDFTVPATDIGVNGGGSITMLTAPATGETLTIKRVTPLTQGTDFANQGAFYPESHEDALDRLTLIAQELSEKVGRSIRVSFLEDELDEIEDGATLANKYVGFDADGNPAVLGGTGSATDAGQVTLDNGDTLQEFADETDTRLDALESDVTAIDTALGALDTDFVALSARFVINGNNTEVKGNSTGEVRLYTNGNQRVTVASDGTVILGATTAAGLGAAGSPVHLQISDTGTTSSDYGLLSLTSGNTAADTLGAIAFASRGLSGSEKRIAQIQATKADALTVNPVGNLELQTANGSFPTTKLTVTADGRVYGSALHDNAGSVTGTTNQYIASGTYTPTLTNTTNISSSTAGKAQWIRVGNVVHVAGSAVVDPIAADTNTVLGISLPVTSNLVGTEDLAGTGSSISDVREPWGIEADGTNNRAAAKSFVATLNSHTINYTFSYEVKA